MTGDVVDAVLANMIRASVLVSAYCNTSSDFTAAVVLSYVSGCEAVLESHKLRDSRHE